MKKSLTMEDLRILDICRDIELLNEELYLYFANLFSKNRELAALWEKTAKEEASHARQFELVIRNSKGMLESVNIDAGTVTIVFEFIRSLLEDAKKNPPSVPYALQLSVLLEKRLASLHLECIACFTEESHKKLFRGMMACDNRHVESLLDAQEKYSQSTH